MNSHTAFATRARRLKDVFYMPNDNKLYLCFEYCEFDLKKYMKSQSYKVRPALLPQLPLE